MSKTTAKKSLKITESPMQELKNEAEVIGKKIVKKFKQAKDKLDSLDKDKKNKILAGIIGAGIAIGVGTAIASKNRKKK